MHSISYIDTIIFPETKNALSKNEMNYWKEVKLRRIISTGAIEWLNDWIETFTFDSKPTLFIAGNKDISDIFIRDVSCGNLRKQTVMPVFESRLEPEIYMKIKNLLKIEMQKQNEKLHTEIQFAIKMNFTVTNIFQIGKCAIQGKVKKLIIADDVNIFGILNRNTGSLVLHTDQQNHFDDDILDDLAQEVLSQGGEVILIPRNEIPDGYLALALLYNEQIYYNKSILIPSLSDKNNIRNF